MRGIRNNVCYQRGFGGKVFEKRQQVYQCETRTAVRTVGDEKILERRTAQWRRRSCILNVVSHLIILSRDFKTDALAAIQRPTGKVHTSP